MATIDVQPLEGDAFAVTIGESGSSTTHVVTGAVDPAKVRGVHPEALVDASFRFLLDREPKEAILTRFSLDVISRYFPEYPERIGDYLGTSS